MSNREKFTKDKENPSVRWEPMRNGNSHPCSEEVGAFSWKPNFVLYAKQLEVNMDSLLKLTENLHLTHQVVIGSLSLPKEDENQTRWSAIMSKNEMVLLGSQNKVKRPKNMASVVPNTESGKIELLVNFSGIAEYVESKLSQGTNDPNYFKIYGQEVNKAIKEKLPLVCLSNYLLEIIDDEGKMAYEFQSVLAGLFMSVGVTVPIIIDLLIQRIQGLDSVKEIPAGALFIFLTFELGYMIGNTLPMILKYFSSNSDNDKAFRDHMTHLSESYDDARKIGKIFYPELMTASLTFPLLRLLSDRETLIRGR
jgi:hypothetical protein